jgi:hypothetical protein
MSEYKILFEHDNDPIDGFGNETAWATKVGDHYKLDNILFYAKDYSLGDIVCAEEINGELIVRSLVSESGHSTVRILFNDYSLIENTLNELKSLGCDYEISNNSYLVAIDIPKEVNYIPIRDYLNLGEASGFWTYEESCLAHEV